ncbi:MAG: hypothetical protein ONA69_06620, partial [candidate division KSB1 bacterium]|nr:hypothetical protein [candidate division KSB1 bacterium]
RITIGGHIPHLIEFFDDNKMRHTMTARQLLNLRRDLRQATSTPRRSYWLPRLALTLNPRGPYWSAGLVWGIPLIASALMPHYFSSPEAHINRIAKNIEPAYGAEVVSKVDPSLLDRMYREFQKSK